MSDSLLKRERAKCRFIIEIRYPPLIELFDHRGRVLSAMQELFKGVADHWQLTDNTVRLVDDLVRPTREFAVQHMKSAVAYEDPESVERFMADAAKFFTRLGKQFSHLNALTRLGFRAISIYAAEDSVTFSNVCDSLCKNFLNTGLGLTLKPTDFRLVLDHDSGHLDVGPVKAGEEWVRQMYKHPDENVPSVGVGVDVDSFATALSFRESAFLDAVKAVQDLTFQVEAEALAGLW